MDSKSDSAQRWNNLGKLVRLLPRAAEGISCLCPVSQPSAVREQLVLEAAFVAWLVALLGDHTVRNARRVLLGDPERRRLEAALAEVTRVAIAAVLRDVPSESREELSRTLCERFRLAPITVLDGRTRVRTALIAAIRQQIAPFGAQAITRSAGCFPGDAGDDGVYLANALADIAIRSIEQLGPGFPVLAPLIAQLNADAAAERDEAVVRKVDSILFLLERQFQAPAGTVQTGWHQRSFVPDAVDRLADALMQIPSILDDNGRNEILKRLPDPLRGAIPRSALPRIQVYGMVETCAAYPHGLRDLRSVIYSFERDSLPMRQFDEVILQLDAPNRAKHLPGIEAGGRE